MNIAQFTGTVIDGDKVGRTIGFPTANLNTKDHGLKKASVYCGYAFVNGSRYTVVLCVNWENIVEVHIIDDFNEDIYGKTMEVFVKHFIRDMEKIDDIEKLKAVIATDIIKTCEFMSP